MKKWIESKIDYLIGKRYDHFMWETKRFLESIKSLGGTVSICDGCGVLCGRGYSFEKHIEGGGYFRYFHCIRCHNENK